jgi:hypothetical protein
MEVIKKCLVAIEQVPVVSGQEPEELLGIAQDMIHPAMQILALAEDLVEAGVEVSEEDSGAKVEAFGGEDIEINITSHKLLLALILKLISLKKRPTLKTL